MNHLTAVAVVLCFASIMAAVRGQKKPCCFPDAFETNFGLQTGEDKPTGHGMTLGGGMAKIFADYKKQKIAVHETFSTGGKAYKTYNITQLILGATKTMYIVQNGKCQKFPMKDFPSNCIPSDASYSGALHLGMAADAYGVGGSGQTMTLDNWSVLRTSPGSYLFVSLMVMPDSCMPVCQGGGLATKGETAMAGGSYFDTRLGIKDPSVFDIPAICKGAEFEAGNPPELNSRKSFLGI